MPRRGMRAALVGRSGGPRRVSWPAIGVRSESWVRWYLSAVALVTAKALPSKAAEGLSALAPPLESALR